MKLLYLDCSMGAAGDMLTAALLELLPDPDAFVEELNAIGIPHIVYQKKTVQKCGIAGTHMSVTVDGVEESDLLQGQKHRHEHEHGHGHHEHAWEHNHHEHTPEHVHHEHHHSSLAEIETIVRDLKISERVKGDILAVYGLIAEAESHVHNCTISEIHFHEVGTFDAIADVTAVCLLMERIAPERVVASPIHVGSGTVRCAHGVLPVPAPATAYILRDVPIYGGEIKSELCTPTGAALLKHFVNTFDKMPPMRVERIGYGMGNKDFPIANCVRAMIGETERDRQEVMHELSVNLDDMTAEQIGFACEQIFAAGAVEVYTTAIGMKKNRPGTLLRAICTAEKREAVIHAIFRHTSTIGIRETDVHRYILNRREKEIDTPFGIVRCKHSEGYGVVREKLEYEDLARIARENECSLTEVRAWIEKEMNHECSTERS